MKENNKLEEEIKKISLANKVNRIFGNDSVNAIDKNFIVSKISPEAFLSKKCEEFLTDSEFVF